jgi:hypothetical protein
MIHQIGGLILLAIAVVVFGRLFGGEVARTWDARWPQTRPSRRQVTDWAASRARSGVSWGHARLVRSRAAGWMPGRLRGVLSRGPAGQGDDDGTRPPCQSCGAREADSDGLCGICITEAESGADAAPVTLQPSDEGEYWLSQTPRFRPAKVVQGTVLADDDSPDAAPATPAEPQSATGRNPGMTTSAAAPAAVPGAEEMTAGMARLRAYAVSGNILHKQAALAALAEVLAQNAVTVAALAQSMQEESMYGPEITEPVAQMAPALSALSTRAAEAESQVASLARTPVGEVPGSRHQAPARAEMAEAGGR